jgi:hypothetical protein
MGGPITALSFGFLRVPVDPSDAHQRPKCSQPPRPQVIKQKF